MLIYKDIIVDRYLKKRSDNMKKITGATRFLLINLGVLIMTAGLYFFLVPNNLAVGGASGFAILINGIIPSIPIGVILLVVNIILFVIGFYFIGKDFGGLTIYSALLMSVLLAIFEKLIPLEQPISEDLFINLIFGIFIQGLGMGIVLNCGASTGGTDIIGKILEKYTNLSFGNGLILIDGLITLGALFVYGPTLGMYALLGVIINGVVIDKMLSGFNTLYSITIVSTAHEAINKFIIEELDRATTLYVAQGGYSKNRRVIVQTVVERRQYVSLREFIRNTDPKAFIYVSNVNEVEGEGFTYEETSDLTN